MRSKGSFWGVLLSFWIAMGLCAAYAAATYIALALKDDDFVAIQSIKFFTLEYGGLVAGTACATVWMMSFLVLPLVPKLIEGAITGEEIEKTDYAFWHRRFESFRLGLSQFSTYFLGGLVIYSVLKFPVPVKSQYFFMIFTSIQYGFGGFIGRKLWCVGHMLRSLESVTPRDDLLESDEFPRLIYLVNIFTFLTLLMTVIHTFYHARISYEAALGVSSVVQPLVYLPMVLALPVLILFNFYPRMVVNRLYIKSIGQKKEWLSTMMQASEESELVKIKYTIDYEKYLSEEFRYRQKVALSELPVALTVAVAILVAVARVIFR